MKNQAAQYSDRFTLRKGTHFVRFYTLPGGKRVVIYWYFSIVNHWWVPAMPAAHARQIWKGLISWGFTGQHHRNCKCGDCEENRMIAADERKIEMRQRQWSEGRVR